MKKILGIGLAGELLNDFVAEWMPIAMLYSSDAVSHHWQLAIYAKWC